MVIVEATAGNTGVGLALAGINRGYGVELYVPEGFAEEKCVLMRAFGATVIRTPEDGGIREAIRQAHARAEAEPCCFLARQFSNAANPAFHHETTARELWEQMDGRVDAFVSGVGTGGTFSGIARFLKEQNRRILTVAVETEGSVLQGGTPGRHRVEGIGVSFVPETFQGEYADEIVRVSDKDAFGWLRGWLARKAYWLDQAPARRCMPRLKSLIGLGRASGWQRSCRIRRNGIFRSTSLRVESSRATIDAVCNRAEKQARARLMPS